MKPNKISNTLPSGQQEIDKFPTFGLSQYAERYQENFGPVDLRISGEVKQSFSISLNDLKSLPKTNIESDFHCVTTWTKRNLNWQGYRFSDFYQKLVKPNLKTGQALEYKVYWVVFKSLDGYRARMLLSDLLNSNSLLADGLNDKPLCSKHGAPIRLVAPAHYGYKNPKHLKAIEFQTQNYQFKPPLFSFMEHPRARVELEERGRYFPGWLLRYLYRPLIKSTIRKFELATKNKP